MDHSQRTERRAALGWTLVLGCALICHCMLAVSAEGVNMTVRNGWELHNAVATPQVTHIHVAANITLTLDTCPMPSDSALKATLITRNVTISSLPADNSSSGNTSSPPYWIWCNYMTDRFEIQSGYKVTLKNLVLVHCRTYGLAGIFRKAAGASVHLDHCVEDFGEVCLPGLLQYKALSAAPRPHNIFPPPGNTSTTYTHQPAVGRMPRKQQEQHQEQQDELLPQQWVKLSAEGSNWCDGPEADADGNSSSPGFVFDPLLPAGTTSPLCNMQALLLGDLAIETSALNTSLGTPGQPFFFQATNVAAVCPQPIPEQCVQANTPEACLLAAYEAVNPDNNAPCIVRDGYSLHNCLVTPDVSRIMLMQMAKTDLSTDPAQESPVVIARNLSIYSDPRGPRMLWDCGLLSNRFQLAANTSLTMNHIILANCSTTKPISIIRMSSGSKVFMNDTIVVQPPGLCLTADDQAGSALHRTRPAGVPGAQSLQPVGAGGWCQHNDSVAVVDHATGSAVQGGDAATGAQKAYLVGLFANTTGLGPGDAATLADPAAVPYFVHSTWPSIDLCNQPALLFVGYAYEDPNGWVTGATNTAVGSDHQRSASNVSDQLQKPGPRFGSDADLINGSYSGAFTMHYVDSAVICLKPAAAADCPGVDPRNKTGCVAAAYQKANPDYQMVPGSAVYAAEAAKWQPPSNYGVTVVLPAVLGSVLGALLLAAIVAAALFIRGRRKMSKAAMEATVAAKTKGLFNGTGSTVSTDPARHLLGIHHLNPNDSGSRMTGTASIASSCPDGIILNILLGAGSFGRVYAGTWNGQPVAVKVITHSSTDDRRIAQELALSLSFDHPNLVRALHYTKVTINPNSPDASLGAPSGAGSSLFLPDGAIGVFNLPSTWAIIQRSSQGGPGPQVDTETWIVMDLMDGGNLAAALRHTNIFVDSNGALNMPRLLRRAADVAAGIAYLHSRNVCHGDLKCENILLKSETDDVDGMMAKVADFGLSRALAYGQSHLSTRRYGTVTHMPPELLVAGKLTPAADVYSFGIMMWEFASRELPFAGMHHGEIIHRVVTEDLRPSPWPQAPPQLQLPSDYIPLAEACWARHAGARPTMPQVLQRLLKMLSEVEGPNGV